MIATIKIFKRYSKITYYTIHFDEKGVTEYNEFLNRISGRPELMEDLRKLLRFVVDVGQLWGAVQRHFKTEGKAFRFLEPGYIETEDPDYFGLRLYCLPVNDKIVILYNGCAKTAQKVQDCENCSYHFHMANLITRKILEALHEDFIRINRKGDELEIDEDFNLIF